MNEMLDGMGSARGALEPLKGRHLLTVADLDATEIDALLDLATELKQRLRRGEPTPLLPGRILAMVFMKKSTRTRVSFEAGIYQLGGTAMFLPGSELQLGHGETIRDTACTMSRYVHAVMIRAADHEDVAAFAEYSTVPVINGMSGSAHPCQTMADLLTMQEHFGRLAGLKVVYLGAGLNVGTSLMIGCAKMGVHFVFSGPAGYDPPGTATAEALRFVEQSGGSVRTERDPLRAVTGADVVCTDGWTPPELEGHASERASDLAPYRLDVQMLRAAGDQARVMHCLPAHYGEEITEDVVHSPASLVFDEAENRLHAQKAVMAALIP